MHTIDDLFPLNRSLKRLLIRKSIGTYKTRNKVNYEKLVPKFQADDNNIPTFSGNQVLSDNCVLDVETSMKGFRNIKLLLFSCVLLL